MQENDEELHDSEDESSSREASSSCSDVISDGAEGVCREVSKEGDYETIFAGESSNQQGQSLAVPSAQVPPPVQSLTHRGESLSAAVAALPSQSLCFQGQSLISAVSSKSNTTPREHTEVDNMLRTQQSCISSIERGNEPISLKTRHSQRSPLTVASKIQTTQSIQFTDGSLKVSLRRPQVLSFPAPPQHAAPPFILGSGLDSPETSSSGSLHSSLTQAYVATASNLTSTTPPTMSASSSIINNPHPPTTTMPSSVELARYFTSLSPLPPVSPKRKKSPNTQLSADTPKSPADKHHANCRNSTPEKPSMHGSEQIVKSSQDKPSGHSNEAFIPPVVASSPLATSSPPSFSSSVAQCSITTQARVTSPTAASTVESERRPYQWTTDQPKSKPTPSSIYQQLLADNKLTLNKSKKSKKSQTRKAKPVSSGGVSKVGAKRSPKEGLSSKLHMSAPLSTNFPTFVIPHIPMGGGGDPSIIVSPVWLGPGSFSGLMSTLPSSSIAPSSTATVHSTLHATAYGPPTLPPPVTACNASLSVAQKTHPRFPSNAPFSTAVRSASHTLTTDHATLFTPPKALSSAPPSAAANIPPSSSLSPPKEPACSVPLVFSAASKCSPFAPPLPGTTITTTTAIGSLVTNCGWSKRASSNAHQVVANYSTGSIPLKPSSVVAQGTTEQPSLLGFGNTQLCSFQSQTSPLLPHHLPPKTSISFDVMTNSTEKANQPLRSNSITEMKVAARAQTMSGQSSAQSEKHHRRWSAANKSKSNLSSLSVSSTGPVQIDMYPDSPPTPSQHTSLFLPINEHLHRTHVVTSTSNTTPSTSSSKFSLMSPPSSSSHLPKNRGQFRFPSVSSELPSPSVLRTSELHSRLESPSCGSITPVPPMATTSSRQSPTTVSGITTTSTSEGSNTADINSIEYRRLILRKVQQWNEEKQRKLHGKAKWAKLMSPSILDDSDPLKSPSTVDAASPIEQFSSTNLSPRLSTDLADKFVGDQTFQPGTSTMSSTGPPAGKTSPSSPKLLVVGPPITFAETLIPRTVSSPLINKKSLLSTLSSPSVPSVAGSAMQMDDILSVSDGSSIVAPSVVFNSAFMGDISSMSRWELEQLYKHNMEKLEQQKKFIRILEVQLKKIHEQHENFGAHKPTQSEIYQRFLTFVVEPELVPDVPIVGADKFGYGHLVKQAEGTNNTPTLNFNEVIKGGTSDRPILNEKYDFYATFGRL